MTTNKTITLRRGLDLHLQGAVEGSDAPKINVGRAAVCPADFPGFIPKLAVREGDTVACGDALMHDKIHPEVTLVAPVAGRVQSVVRGERRKILRVVIDLADTQAAPAADKAPMKATTADEVVALLCRSGLLAMMRQRPYDIVPNPDVRPRDIFVTAFDSAPLAPDLSLYVEGRGREIAAGVDALRKVTAGNVYISTPEGSSVSVPEGAVHIIIKGEHPAGTVGAQIANIAPVNKGETVWTLDIVTLARIGEAVLGGGTCSWDTMVALTGSEVEHPHYISTCAGAEIAPLVKGQLKDSGKHQRIISGNVLTGTTESAEGFLRFPYRQITVIPEGDDVNEFMGWASVSPGKLSTSRSFPSHFLFKKLFAPDSRINGGRRAMIMSEQYDKVMPMDIYPEYLVKAIIARDIDKMEQLGIYEVAPEDFALAEFVDPSKLELQKIVREGLDYLRKELD